MGEVKFLCSDVNMKSGSLNMKSGQVYCYSIRSFVLSLLKLKILHVLTLVFVLLFLPHRSDVVEGVIPEDMVEECTNKRQELIGT